MHNLSGTSLTLKLHIYIVHCTCTCIYMYTRTTHNAQICRHYTHIQSKLAVLRLPHRGIHPDLHTVGVRGLHKVVLTNNEGQQVHGHDGCGGKGHLLQTTLHILAAHLILDGREGREGRKGMERREGREGRKGRERREGTVTI